MGLHFPKFLYGSMPKSILIACNISETFHALLQEKGYRLVYDAEHPEEIIGIFTSNKWVLNKKEIDSFPHLKWIGRLGSGMEIIDTAYCRQKGILCVSSPEGIANAVAEHITGMLINMQKNICRAQQEIKNKQWIREPNRGWELENKILGIIGFGHTGRKTAEKLKQYVSGILVYDKYISGFKEKHVVECDLKTLCEKSDIISFHVPLNTETRNYYNDTFLANSNEHILINTSRGDIVNNQTLLSGLKSGKIKGACLDVIQGEEFLSDHTHEQWDTLHALLNYHVILTPHIAGYSHEAIEKMSFELYEALKSLL